MARRALERDWTTAFYASGVFTPGSPEAVAAAPSESRFVWRALGLKRGSRVLDIACGTGRHARELSRRGADVVGVDASARFLAQARRRAPRARFLRGDMRRLPFRAEFDAAVSLWTSFGYFRRPSDDLAVLEGAARALKPGGRLLIDVRDFESVLRQTHRRNWGRRPDGSYLLEAATVVTGADPRTINEWTVLAPGKRPKTASFTLRGYDKPRLVAALEKAGLSPLRVWGGLDGRPHGPGSSRLVVLAERPAAGPRRGSSRSRP